MLREIDNYFLLKDEPAKGCLAYLRQNILKLDENIAEAWKYSMPFYCYKGKMFCYLWTKKDTGQPYIGIVEGHKIDHPDLIIEKRAKMKIMLIDADGDIPVANIDAVLRLALARFKQR